MEKIHLAIADGQLLFREGITRILNDFGNVIVDIDVSNGKLLLDKLSACSVPPHICVFDVSMPVINGYETLKHLKGKWPSIKVLILSSHSNKFAVLKALRDGANGYLLKNSSIPELHKAIQSIHLSGFYYPESISGSLINLLQNNTKDAFPLLSDREMQFLSLCPTNLTYKQIGELMFVSSRTIDKFSKVLFDKLNVHSRTALAAFALSIGLNYEYENSGIS
jgi:DNA-binding NarL/FixJ family response regulator